MAGLEQPRAAALRVAAAAFQVAAGGEPNRGGADQHPREDEAGQLARGAGVHRPQQRRNAAHLPRRPKEQKLITPYIYLQIKES